MKTISIHKLTRTDIQHDDYVVFGGTFDPFHEGHLDVAIRLTEYFSLVIVAPTLNNPWKGSPGATLSQRIEMIRLVLLSGGAPIAHQLDENGIYISSYEYSYAEDLVTHLKAKKIGNIFWSVGEDISDSVLKWKNWDTLGVTTITVPIDNPIHAAQIRAGAASLHPAIKNYTKRHCLYGQ